MIGSGETTITVTPVSGKSKPVTIKVTSYESNPDGKGIITGLKDFATSGAGKWYVTNGSYAVKSNGDTFAMSSTNITAKNGMNYTFETNATVSNYGENCTPSLVLFSKTKEHPTDGSLVFNIQANNGHWKVFEFGGNLIGEGDISKAIDGKYNMKVDIVGEKVKYSINGQDVMVTSNYSRKSGYVGLMNWDAKIEFRKIKFNTGS